jgi:hypothetical protein
LRRPAIQVKWIEGNAERLSGSWREKFSRAGVKKGIEEGEMVTTCFFLFCWLAPPAVVPDGAGGYVPFTNSRVMPDGSLRPYDPVIDGVAGAVPDGFYPSVVPMPDYPGLVPPPPEYAYPESYERSRQADPPR